MKHSPHPPEQDDLLRPRLVDMIDMRHELVMLAGHTLDEALEQVTILTGTAPKLAVVDHGYRGQRVTGTRRGLTPSVARLLRRRSAIEPEIGHMKTDGRLARRTLKGTLGDAIFAVLCGCGHNIRKILGHLRVLLRLILDLIRPQTGPNQHRQIHPKAV